MGENSKKSDKDRALLRHRRIYRLFRAPCKLVMRILFSYKSKTEKEPDGPFLLLANHTMGIDPIVIGCSFKSHMYFVAGEHVYRMGWLSRFLGSCFAPIQRVKGSTDASAALAIIRALRRGANVCLFPEGNRTFTGKLMPIHPATAKLIKSCGATILTYRIIGGYLSTPRWSEKRRRGRLEGRLVGTYPAEQIRKMSGDEINALLVRDLGEDAYTEQKAAPIAYKGKRLAEKLETAIYLCPRCGGIETLKSENNRFYCGCGLNMTIDACGFFRGEALPFHNPDEWDDWQEAELRRLAETLGDGEAFGDDGQILYEQNDDHTLTKVSEGRLSLYKDRLVLGDKTIPLDKISSIEVVLREDVVFTAGNVHYAVASDHVRSGRKYVTLFKYLRLYQAAKVTQNPFA